MFSMPSLPGAVDADDHDRFGRRGVLGPVVDIGAFGDRLARLVGPVRAPLAVLGQSSLHDIAQGRTAFVAVKADHSAWFDRDLPHAHLALRKVVQSLLAA